MEPRTEELRASVGSTDASDGRLARVGRIDEWHQLRRNIKLGLDL
jgi:hypothetical protein